MKADSRDTRKSPLAEIIDRISGAEAYNQLFAGGKEPAWFFKVAERLQRSYAPELKPELLKINAPSALGSTCATEFTFAGSFLDFETEDLPYERFSLTNPDALLIRLRLVDELNTLKQQIVAALDSPFEDAAEFFIAFGEGLKRKAAFESMARAGDSRTVQICLFLIFEGRAIEAGHYSSVSQLAIEFIKRMKRAGGIADNASVEAAVTEQFRKICSEDGIRLRGRGRPRKQSSTKNVAKAEKKASRKRSQKKPLSSGK